MTAVCGSGPAFVCLVLEAMADGGVMMGLPRSEALELAAQSMSSLSLSFSLAVYLGVTFAIPGTRELIFSMSDSISDARRGSNGYANGNASRSDQG